jgi:MATE family multidrug resistance protein
MKKRFFSLLPELRKTVRLALPIAIGNGAHGLLTLTDAVMAGHLENSTTALAAASFAGALMSLPFIFGMGLVVGVSVLTAQGRGAGHPEHAEVALRHGLFVAGAFGLTVAAATHIAVSCGQLELFGQPVAVAAEAADFAIFLGWSTLPGLLFQCFKNHRESVNQAWVALMWNGGGVALNLFFNWLFMFGHFGCPEMGLAGAGLGTLLSRLVMLAGIVAHPGGSVLRLYLGVSVQWLGKMFRLGAPSAVQWVLEAGIFAVAPVLIGRFGETQLAAHQVALSLATFAFMVPLGLSQAASIRTGEAFGTGNLSAMRRISGGAILTGMAFMAVYGAVVILFREQIPSLFLNAAAAPETAVFAKQFVLVAAAFALFDGIQVVASGALRGMNDVRFASVSALLCYWGVALATGLPLAYGCGLEGLGIWAGLACGIFAAAVTLGWRLAWKLRLPAKTTT